MDQSALQSTHLKIYMACFNTCEYTQIDLFRLESCIHGHHIYKDVWTPVVDEQLNCRREEGNISDPYAVATVKSGNIVGHKPRQISATCNLFIQKGGNILCKVTGLWHYSDDLPQGGLEVPCELTFRGDRKLVAKISRLLRPGKTDCKNPIEIKCEAEKILKTADEENPRNKLKKIPVRVLMILNLFVHQ